MEITIPRLSLVVLIGPSGSGKSTFARKHFLPTEVLSSDFCRGLVSDDENDQTATNDAFELLHYVAGKRLTRGRLTVFLDSLVSHYVFDQGRLVVAHAGIKEEMQGRGSGRVREFALYGETTGETDEFGLPVRYNWAAEYRGSATVVYGHTPVPEPEWLNRTVNIDTGCVFGGKLTARRFPEKEYVSVSAERTYCEPARTFLTDDQQMLSLSAQQLHDDILDAADVLGKRIISTRLQRNITIREENATAAIEVMSRFAANPKWLIYLPPTMSPCETSNEPGLLEHPAEAFAYFRSQGVPQGRVRREAHGIEGCGGQMPWKGVPADYLRPGLRLRGESVSTAQPQPGPEAITGSP